MLPKSLLSFVLAVAAVSQLPAAPYAFDVPQPAPDVFRPYAAVCHLRVGNVSGSGTLIAVTGDKALVLSCRHVCGQAGNGVIVRWFLAGGQASAGTVVRVLPGNGFDTDLALVVCQRPVGVAPVRVAWFNPINGPFVGAGWRDGQLRVAVAANAQLRGESIVWLPAPFVGGMSGGPLFNRYGQIVAVVVASDRVYWGLSCNGPHLHNLIREFRSSN